MKSVSVIIPMYNEDGVIEDTIGELTSTIPKYFSEWELIFVDDGSNDDTCKIVCSFAKKDEHIKLYQHKDNLGRGAALKTGFKHAKNEIVVTIDSDLSYSPSYIPLLVKKMEETDADVVLGSTFKEDARMVNVPFFRALLSKIGNRILTLSLNKNLTVVTCVFRAYKRHVIKLLDIDSNDKTFHLESLSKILDMGYKVKEVPTSLKWRKDRFKRKKRKSKFKINMIFTHMFFSFSETPLLLLGSIASIMILTGIIIGLFILHNWLTNPGAQGRSALLILMTILLVGGLQVILFNFSVAQNRIIIKRINKLQRNIILKDSKEK